MKPFLLALVLLVPALAIGQSRLKPPTAPAPAAEVEDKTPRDPNKYAALSLLGDSVQLISLTAARGDTVQSGEWTATPAGKLDAAALQAINDAVKARSDKLETKLYTSSTRSLFGDPANLFVDGKLTLPGNLVAALRQSGAAQLLLVTRSRQEPGLAAALPARILAMLEGPGFVLDQRLSANIGFDGQPDLPVFVPYVSLRVALIDLADMRLKREQSLAVAARLPVAREAAANPWAATTAEQRVKALEALIEAELPRAVKGLLAP
ncbi:hypothetical protein [Roseateles sp.]|uniref:hypothetical protein n=1 Tax=Roseateles sp. TaxID=1971397 RepID=UPI003265AF33